MNQSSYLSYRRFAYLSFFPSSHKRIYLSNPLHSPPPQHIHQPNYLSTSPSFSVSLSVCVSLCLCLCVCLYVCLSVCLSIYLAISLSIYIHPPRHTHLFIYLLKRCPSKERPTCKVQVLTIPKHYDVLILHKKGSNVQI